MTESSIYRRGLGQLILNAPTSYAVCAKAHVREAHNTYRLTLLETPPSYMRTHTPSLI